MSSESPITSPKEIAEEFLRSHLEPSDSENRAALNDKFFNKEAYQAAIQNRGFAFIGAAKLIVENPYGGKDQRKKDSILHQLNEVEKTWKKMGEEGLTTEAQALDGLMYLLCEKINGTVYKGNRKNIKQLVSELANAENHYNWKKREEATSLVRLNDNLVQVRLDIPITRFTKVQEAQWEKILKPPSEQPKWFKELPQWEQNYFISKLEKWKDQKPRPNLGDFLGTPPTTIRAYPGARNGYRSYVFTYEEQPRGKFTLKDTFYKLRSGHISPSKMKNKKERFEAAKENIKQLILEGVEDKIKAGEKDILIDLQTLITPPFLKDDRIMDRDRLKAIKQIRKEFQGEGFGNFLRKNNIDFTGDYPNITLITSNQPVNRYRVFANIGLITSPARNKENRKVLKELKNRIKSLPDGRDKSRAEAAITRISEISRFTRRVRNFFVTGINHNAERAALEQIAVSALRGVRVGSCMSGKDREGAVSIHAAAMAAFYQKHKSFPPIPGVSKRLLSQRERDLREEYEKMVAKQFLTGHDQRIAEANALGCAGLKGAKTILGANVFEKIKTALTSSKPKSAMSESFKPEKINNEIAHLNRIEYKSVEKVKAESAKPEHLKIEKAKKGSYLRRIVHNRLINDLHKVALQSAQTQPPPLSDAALSNTVPQGREPRHILSVYGKQRRQSLKSIKPKHPDLDSSGHSHKKR